MSWMTILAAVILVAHGLIHLMGTTVYLRLGQVTGIALNIAILIALFWMRRSSV